MKNLWLLVIVTVTFGLGLLLSTVPVSAHHAFASEFDANQPVTLKGTISKMAWTNPHGWLYIDVKRADGSIDTWACELGAVNRLLRAGWRKEDLPVGTEVTVLGFRGRTPALKANARDIIMANGRKLFAGSSDTGAPGDK